MQYYTRWPGQTSLRPPDSDGGGQPVLLSDGADLLYQGGGGV